MKSHIRTKGPIFSMRLRGPHAAGRVLESIKSMTCDLEDLQVEIYSRMGGPAEILQGFSRREREAAERTLNDFKLAVDQLRYVLWLSLGPQAEGPREKDLPVEARHPRAEAPLPPARSRSSVEAPTSASFFDRLDVVIEAYMSKNTPSGAAQRKRLKN